jgi:ribose/xylose/arabinose/galactoside ABC-type transport system permease subunit
MVKNISLKSKTYRSMFIILILILEITIFSILSDKFLTVINITNVLRRGLDLSVGSVLALSGCISAYAIYFGYPTWVAILIGIIIGSVIGFINGSLVVFGKITPVIVTLGMMYIARGTVYIMTGGGPIYLDEFPKFGILGRGYVGPIPIPVIILIVLFAVFFFIMKMMLFGKYIYSVGGNIESARLSGINVNRVRFFTYIITGALAGFSGVMMASRLASGQPSMGGGFEFDVIVAVILGGTSLAGGEGTITGTLVGALIVGIINNGLNLVGVSAWYQSVFKGLILIGAVLMDVSLKGEGMHLGGVKKLQRKSSKLNS